MIDQLRAGAEVLEPHGLAMVLEPLNPWRDHPGMFLTKIPQAYEVCRAVNSPACKILFDIYHQQITEGISSPTSILRGARPPTSRWATTPAGREPGTGEINYRNVFRHIHSKGFTGVVGMEHGKSIGGSEGEDALVNAYRASDQF